MNNDQLSGALYLAEAIDPAINGENKLLLTIDVANAASALRKLCAEVKRLTACISKSNEQAAHFEREWYFRGDVIERQAARIDALQEDLSALAAQAQAKDAEPETDDDERMAVADCLASYAAPVAQAEPRPEGEWPKCPSPYQGDQYIGYSRTDLLKYAREVLAAHGIKEQP